VGIAEGREHRVDLDEALREALALLDQAGAELRPLLKPQLHLGERFSHR